MEKNSIKNSETNIEKTEPIVEEAFTERHKQTAERIVERYEKFSEISEDSKKFLDEFLEKEADSKYAEFALRWFDDPANQEKMKKEGFPVEGVKDDYKIYFVFKHWKLKKDDPESGWGIGEEMYKGKYEDLVKEVNKIEGLRMDLAKKILPPETPYLLLNYLQNLFRLEKNKLDSLIQREAVLKSQAKSEESPLSLEIASKQKQLEQLFLAMKELAEKTMKENLEEIAEEDLRKSGFLLKDLYLSSKQKSGKTNLEVESEKLKTSTSDLLISKEWEEFEKLTTKEKEKFLKKLGGSPILITNKADFARFLLSRAKENGIEGDAFYGLLQQGYMPYQVKYKFMFWPPYRIFTLRMSPREVLGKNGKSFISDGTTEDFDRFLKNAADQYNKDITESAQKKLEEEWQEMRDQKIKENIERRINEIASSPDKAEGGIESIFAKVRERIIAKYIEERTKKNPKSAKQIEELRKEINIKDKEIDVGSVIRDIIFVKGKLEELKDIESNKKGKWRKILADYFSDLGIDSVELPSSMKKKGVKFLNTYILRQISNEDYEKAMATQGGLFALILRFINLRQETLEKIKKEKNKKNKNAKNKPKPQPQP